VHLLAGAAVAVAVVDLDEPLVDLDDEPGGPRGRGGGAPRAGQPRGDDGIETRS